MNQFNAESTTSEVIAGIDLAGKQAVVTGASAGLGVETARALASAGAAVMLVARDGAKLEAARAQLQADLPTARFDTALLDLADLDSVRAGAAAIARQCPSIDILVNNAGVMACPLLRTAQGFELQFGTNHLGHFLLTSRLAPALLAGAPSRVVNLSSMGHKAAPVNLEDPNYQHRDYEKWQAYGEAKTANVLFSVGLEQRLGGRGVHSYAVHPGVIMTELSRHLEQEDFDLLAKSSGPEFAFKTPEAGAATSVWAATSPSLEGRGGIYLEDCHEAALAVAGGEGGVEAYALDQDVADRLWELSEQLVGESFNLG
jgi:NAD(P)-dependent dehydrogenase (short-subunit alcohol dehydrogenase family)